MMAKPKTPAAKKPTAAAVKTAADKAEASAKKKAAAAASGAGARAGDKAPPKVKVEKPTPKRVDISNMDRADQEAFLQHLKQVKAQRDKIAGATADLRNMYKEAKGHGFEKADFDTAIAIETAEKEAKLRAKIARQFYVSKLCGKKLGNQLELFSEPDRTPSSDIAFEEGTRDCMDKERAKPAYDPSTEQYRRYMEGYHAEQARQLKGGIKPTEKPAKPAKAAAAAAPAATGPEKQTAAAEDPPNAGIKSGVFMNRADLERERQAAVKAATAPPNPEGMADEDDNDDEPSAFRKREDA
jgi:hypothetical protein